MGIEPWLGHSWSVNVGMRPNFPEFQLLIKKNNIRIYVKEQNNKD